MDRRQFPHHAVLTAAAVVIVVAGLRAAQSLVVPLVFALFLAILLTPPLRWFERKGVPTSLSLVLVMLLLTCVVVGGFWSVSSAVTDFSRGLPRYQQALNEQWRQLEDWFGRVWPAHSGAARERTQLPRPVQDLAVQQRRAFGPHVESQPAGQPPLSRPRAQPPSGAADADAAGVHPAAPSSPTGLESSPEGGWHDDEPATAAMRVAAALDAPQPVPLLVEVGPTPSQQLPWTIETIRSFLRGLATLLGSAVVIVITAVFMLLEVSRLPDKLRAARGVPGVSRRKFDEITRNVRRYLAIKTGTSLLTGALIWLLVVLLGLDYAALWGFLAFLFNFVPQIGSILAAIPAIVLALVDQGLGTAAAAVVGYLVVNCTVSYGLEPRFFGQGLGLSMLVVFVSLVFWGWVLGPVGMFLSAPLTMVVKIALEDFEETRWIAILLGSKAPTEPGGPSPAE